MLEEKQLVEKIMMFILINSHAHTLVLVLALALAYAEAKRHSHLDSLSNNFKKSLQRTNDTVLRMRSRCSPYRCMFLLIINFNKLHRFAVFLYVHAHIEVVLIV